MAELRTYIGLDGGGSKTSGVLIADDGRVLACHLTKGAAVPPVGEPSDAACATFRSAAEKLCGQAGVAIDGVRRFGIGLSGIDFPDQFTQQRLGIAVRMGISAERLALANDGIAALWGATSSPAATILQHGTAFTSAFRTKHGQETLFDNLNTGQTFDIRRAINPLVGRMIDGRAEPTPLVDRMLEHYGVSADEFADSLYRALIPFDRLRSAIHVVIEAWLAGDPAAEALVERAAADYALAAKAMVARTGCPTAHAAFGGGVIAQMPAEFWDLLARHVHGHWPKVTVKPSDLAPEIGAAIMAAFNDGIEPMGLFENVRKTMPK